MFSINSLLNECFKEIFKHVRNQGSGLFTSLLVNKLWCVNVVYVLWSKPFEFIAGKKGSRKTASIIQMYLKFLSKEDRKEIEILVNENGDGENEEASTP